MATTRNDPYTSYRFRLDINGVKAASFSQATIPDSSTDSVDYREGTDPLYNRKLSAGPVKYGTLSLKRGISDSMDLYNWRKQIEEQGAGSGRQNITITLIDETGNDTVTWNIFQAWPSKYESSELNATSTEVLIETLEVQLEKIERVK